MRIPLDIEPDRAPSRTSDVLRAMAPRQFKILGLRDTAWFYAFGLVTVAVLLSASPKTNSPAIDRAFDVQSRPVAQTPYFLVDRRPAAVVDSANARTPRETGRVPASRPRIIILSAVIGSDKPPLIHASRKS